MVLALCGYSASTLWARIKAGRMPKAIDRGAEGYIWLRDDVLLALGLIPGSGQTQQHDPWDIDPELLRKALAPKPRRRQLPP